ncbi:hypothetical protein [Arthrobacter sp. PAMC 25486]|uniref:hypothetical protein n=1 Tax=Arthrobacter sp. PAMC 25486 TaxID=1494608 RepID=UPI000B22ABB8|nr:hypothetical protein [Arthrobacter sp. PAMC 25486]
MSAGVAHPDNAKAATAAVLMSAKNLFAVPMGDSLAQIGAFGSGHHLVGGGTQTTSQAG